MRIMKDSEGPIIDMTPSGQFAQEPITAPALGTIVLRVLLFTIALGFAALAFWVALFTVPILMILGLVGYGWFRFNAARGHFRFNKMTASHVARWR